MLGVRHRVERAAELDDIPVAVVPIVEQREIVSDVVDRHDGPRSILRSLYRIAGRSEAICLPKTGIVPGLLAAEGIGFRAIRKRDLPVSVSRGAIFSELGLRPRPVDRAGMIGRCACR